MTALARSSGLRTCSGFPIDLIECTEGSLQGLATFLNDQGLCASCSTNGAEQNDGDGQQRLRLIELGPNRSAEWLVKTVKSGQSIGPSMAIIHSAYGKDLSKALASGCDDAILAPIEPDEFLRRLDAVATLAQLREELTRRRCALAEFGAVPKRDYLIPDLPKPHTLVVGPASQAQVRIIEMLGDTPTAFTDTCDQASRLLLAEPFDLVIFSATDAQSCSDALHWSTIETNGPTSLLFTADQEIEVDRGLRRFDDQISVHQSIECICLRLQFWRKIASLRRALREGPPSALADMTVDSLTGLANHGFLFAYADQCQNEPANTQRVVIMARLANLRDINRQNGFPQGNMALRRMGRTMRRHLRASDLLSHLGAGRYAATLTGVDRQDLSAIMARMNEALANVSAANGDWHLRPQLRGGLVDKNESLTEALERILSGSTRFSESA